MKFRENKNKAEETEGKHETREHGWERENKYNRGEVKGEGIREQMSEGEKEKGRRKKKGKKKSVEP